jgi:hypothetical protein
MMYVRVAMMLVRMATTLSSLHLELVRSGEQPQQLRASCARWGCLKLQIEVTGMERGHDEAKGEPPMGVMSVKRACGICRYEYMDGASALLRLCALCLLKTLGPKLSAPSSGRMSSQLALNRTGSDVVAGGNGKEMTGRWVKRFETELFIYTLLLFAAQ